MSPPIDPIKSLRGSFYLGTIMDETTENIEEIQQNSNLDTDSSDIIEQTGSNSSKPAPLSTVALIDKKIDTVSNNLERLEKLILVKIYNKLNDSYYIAWTSDIRKNYGLAFTLRRRAKTLQKYKELQEQAASQATESISTATASAPAGEPSAPAGEPSASAGEPSTEPDPSASAPSLDKTDDLAS
jgi:hypothetical protein